MIRETLLDYYESKKEFDRIYTHERNAGSVSHDVDFRLRNKGLCAKDSRTCT
jgi:hypothetical protein